MASISHHYNPQVYLRQFAHKKEFWEYDLTNGTAEKSTPQESGCEDYYHSFIGSDGQRDDDTLEKSFFSIENRLPELFEAIRHLKPISDELKGVFFWFAAIQRARSPKMIASIQKGLKKLHEATWEMVKHTPHFDRWMIARGLEPDKVREAEFEIQPSRGHSLLMLLERSEILTECFAKMKWAFLCAPPDKFFFTNDDPVCCWSPPDKRGPLGDVGPETPEVEITFPLSRRICAYGSWNLSPPLYSEMSSQQMNGINFRTILNGWNYVYGPTKDDLMLELVQDSAKRRSHVAD